VIIKKVLFSLTFVQKRSILTRKLETLACLAATVAAEEKAAITRKQVGVPKARPKRLPTHTIVPDVVP